MGVKRAVLIGRIAHPDGYAVKCRSTRLDKTQRDSSTAWRRVPKIGTRKTKAATPLRMTTVLAAPDNYGTARGIRRRPVVFGQNLKPMPNEITG